MKTIYKSALGVAALSLLATGCIDDKSTMGCGVESLPAITAAGGEATAEVNTNFGETCVIDPQIDYNGTGTLEYTWEKCTYTDGARGAFEYVSSEPVFEHFFPTGGTYIVKLNCTDGSTGITKEYEVNINRTFERGFMVLATDADGSGNLTFIKDLTPEEVQDGKDNVVVEHVMEKINPQWADGAPLLGVEMTTVSWPAPGYTRLTLGSETHIYFMDPNELTMVNSVECGQTIPGFRGKYFFPDQGCVRVYDPSTGRFVTANLENMFGMEKGDYKGRGAQRVISSSYYAWGSTYPLIYFLGEQPLAVESMYYSYDSSYNVEYYWETSRDITKAGVPLFDGEELVVAFKGETITEFNGYYDADVYPFYVLSHNPSTGKYYTTELRDADLNSYYEMSVKSRAETSVNGSTALPAQGSIPQPSDKYSRTYYYNGSSVYMTHLLNSTFILPSQAQACLSYPAGEEVTDIYVRDDQGQLIVSTVNTATGRGNMYIYPLDKVRTDNPGTEPVKTYKDFTGRIHRVFYKKSI